MADLPSIIATMQGQIAELQRRQGNVVRSGRVVDVDASKGLVKVDLGDDENPLPSPWIPWAERAGARKTWNPPSIGELMTVLSRAGEIDEKSLAMPGGFTSDNPAPSSNGDALAFSLGPLSIEVTGAAVTLSIGGFTCTISGAGLDADGGYVKNDGKVIDKTHKHDGVLAGGATTGEPV